MEYLGEKVAFLKGLAEGLKLEDSSKEGKVLLEIINVLDLMTSSIADMEDDIDDLSDLIDEMDEDLGEVEQELYGDYDDDGEIDDSDMDFYEILCPNCNEKIYVDDEMIGNDEINCPNCNEKIEIEFDCDCGDDCGCDCGCE